MIEAFIYTYILINLAALAYALMRVEKMNDIIANPNGQRVWGVVNGERFDGYVMGKFNNDSYVVGYGDGQAIILQSWEINPNIF
jgi:hypothetical protein